MTVEEWELELASEFRRLEQRNVAARFTTLRNITTAMRWKYGRSQWGDPHMPWGGLGTEHHNYIDPTIVYSSTDPVKQRHECIDLAIREVFKVDPSTIWRHS